MDMAVRISAGVLVEIGESEAMDVDERVIEGGEQGEAMFAAHEQRFYNVHLQNDEREARKQAWIGARSEIDGLPFQSFLGVF